MASEESGESFELATDPSVVRRDRLLGALFAEDEDTCLLQHSTALSHLLTKSGAEQVFLLPTRDRDAAERLPFLAGEVAVAAERSAAPTHLVAIGGGPAIAAALRRIRPAQDARLGLHHVDDASRYAFVLGEKLPIVERAIGKIRGTEPPSPERIREALHKGRSLASRDRRAISSLARSRSPVTMGLVGACLAVGVLTALLSRSIGKDETYFLLGVTNGELVRGGEVWRLFASTFLHGGVPHFVMNMLALWSLGGMLEPLFGPRRFLVLYGLAGLGGALATSFAGPARFSVGASGAIWGLMAAVLAVVLFPRGLLPPLFVARLKKAAWRPLGVNIMISFLPGVDYVAHFGGGLVGFVITALFLTRGLVPVEQRTEGESVEPTPRFFLTFLAALMSLLMAVSVGVGVVHGVEVLRSGGE